MLPNFMKTSSIDVFVEIPGVPTEKLLEKCLYTIGDPGEITAIVANLKPVELSWETQRKAANWLLFELPSGTVKADLDEDACELRVRTSESRGEYTISEESCRELNRHIRKARPLYERQYRGLR